MSNPRLTHSTGFLVRSMSRGDANEIALWKYPDPYSFYDFDADPDDLAELLNPLEWGVRYFAVDSDDELVGFLVGKSSRGSVEIGLGLRPELTGNGLGRPFVKAVMGFATDHFGAQTLTLAVAQFNKRAIRTYERAGFRPVELYDHETNGGVHPFLRMMRDAPRPSSSSD